MNIEDYQRTDIIKAALAERSVAIVGLSSNELRASHFVGYYMARHGYEITPVNPRETEVLGKASYAALTDIEHPITLVDVFRASDAVPEIAEQAVAIGAKYLWLQFGVISEEGVAIAERGGIQVIMDRCLKIEHARHIGRMHWLGFNTETLSAKRR